MEVDNVSGSEPEEEDWEYVDEVRRRSMCYNCVMIGLFARFCRRKGKCEGKGGDGGKGYDKGKGTTMKGTGKKGSGNFGGSKGGYSGEQKGRRYEGHHWTPGRTQVIRMSRRSRPRCWAHIDRDEEKEGTGQGRIHVKNLHVTREVVRDELSKNTWRSAERKIREG